MYISYDGIEQKKLDFVKKDKKSLIMWLKIWRPWSIPVASRTLRVVWGASGMLTTQYQRTPLVPGALWRSAVDVLDCVNGFPMDFSLVFVDFVDFCRFSCFSLKTMKKRRKSMNGHWKKWLTHRLQIARGRQAPAASSDIVWWESPKSLRLLQAFWRLPIYFRGAKSSVT